MASCRVVELFGNQLPRWPRSPVTNRCGRIRCCALGPGTLHGGFLPLFIMTLRLFIGYQRLIMVFGGADYARGCGRC